MVSGTSTSTASSSRIQNGFKGLLQASWEGGLVFLSTVHGLVPSWNTMLTCGYWKEIEEKEIKIIKSMESQSYEERLKISQSFSLKERRLKADLADTWEDFL